MLITIPLALSSSSIRFHKSLSLSFITKKSQSLIRFPFFSFSFSSSSSSSMDSSETRTQNVVVMRHGDRLDNFEPLWLAGAARPWDPPLFETGLSRAFCTGRRLRAHHLGFPINRVFVSPFLRCVQTAAEAVAGLCAVADDPSAVTSRDVAPADLDASKVKVSVEFGLCEMLNFEAIRPQSAPKDGQFGFSVSELESLLPSGTVDHSFEPIYKELPKWPEKVAVARNRYAQVIKALADKCPNENLLLVTHGEGVGVAVSTFMEGVTVYEVEYCAYAVLKRPVFRCEDEPAAAASFGEFEVDRTHRGHTGIRYLPLRHADELSD